MVELQRKEEIDAYVTPVRTVEKYAVHLTQRAARQTWEEFWSAKRLDVKWHWINFKAATRGLFTIGLGRREVLPKETDMTKLVEIKDRSHGHGDPQSVFLNMDHIETVKDDTQHVWNKKTVQHDIVGVKRLGLKSGDYIIMSLEDWAKIEKRVRYVMLAGSKTGHKLADNADAIEKIKTELGAKVEEDTINVESEKK